MNKARKGSGIWPKIGFASMVLAPLATTVFLMYTYVNRSTELAARAQEASSVTEQFHSLDKRLNSMWDGISQNPTFSLEEIKQYCLAVDMPGIGLAGKVRQLCDTYDEHLRQSGMVGEAGLAYRKAKVDEHKFGIAMALSSLMTAVGIFFYLNVRESVRKDAEKAAVEHPRQHL